MSAGLIRPATAGDAEVLERIGVAAYLAAYAGLWDRPEALTAQLDTFRAEAFAELLARPQARVWIAEWQGEAVGFLSLIAGSPGPVSSRAGGAEIPRIYLLPEACGRGLGFQLLRAAVAFAGAEGLCYLWLDVMAVARPAIKAYRRWGFVETGRKTFGRPLRAGMTEMLVLELTL